ncbi:MAG: signal peptidase I [Pseudomonadales bacterium]|nr:signal peptidase I [Pseudomonadales bacterium]MCP5182972.1 signal peptidase I [Pseudomonadales bacterium]
MQWFRNNRGFLLFLLCLGLFRTAVADWNHVPSGSMRPTILEGDVLFINRLAFDLRVPLTDLSVVRLGEPRRGDIVVFSSPRDGTRLIKRLVALPGDVVEIRHNRLSINGQPAEYDHLAAVTETVGDGIAVPATRGRESLGTLHHAVQFLDIRVPGTDFGPVVVPDDQYFMLGDNRNNSEDSRFIGFVPRHLLIGRAVRVLVSADIQDSWQPRFSRFGGRLDDL